ncbi:MAG: YIP1 family protein [Candidatus Hodarchaeota archaeon]
MVVKLILGTAFFRRSSVEEIEQNEALTKYAWIFLIVEAVIIFLSAYFGPGTGLNPPLDEVIQESFWAFTTTLILYFSIAIIGNLLGGETSFGEILRVMGFTVPITWIIALIFYFLPDLFIIWLIFILYLIAVSFYVLMVAIGKGAFTAIICVIVAVIITLIFSSLLFYALTLIVT